jgi:hypothetical protein
VAERLGVGTEIITALPYLPNLDCPQAGDIITSVRDLGPDPCYDDVTGEPLPDADGSFLRASTLYRWLTNGIRELTRRCNWTVLDWTAMAQETRQQVYALDRRFINVDGCFANQYRLMHLDELHTMYPSYAVAQPLWFSWHHRSDKLELALWPAPDRTDPQANLMTTLAPDAQVVYVNTTAGFLPFGWVQIGSELLQYSALIPATETEDAAVEGYDLGGFVPPVPPDGLGGYVPPDGVVSSAYPRLAVVRRGVSGTSRAIHYAGDPVRHLGIWCRGWRVPAAVRRSTDCVELPMAFQAPLESYVLSKYREAEQDRQSAQSLMQEFMAMTNDILIDPTWQQPPFPMQARAYGDSMVGGMAWGRVVVP